MKKKINKKVNDQSSKDSGCSAVHRSESQLARAGRTPDVDETPPAHAVTPSHRPERRSHQLLMCRPPRPAGLSPSFV